MNARVVSVSLFLVTFSANCSFGGDAPFVRRLDVDEDTLRKELLLVPDIGMSQRDAAELYDLADKLARQRGSLPNDIGGRFFAEAVSASNFSTFPWKKGVDATLSLENAKRLDTLSDQLRTKLMAAASNKADLEAESVRRLISVDGKRGRVDPDFQTTEAIPALVQLLQAEDRPVRSLLVETLADMKGKSASIVLAQRAIYDLSSDVREQAVKALSERPRQEYQEVLFEGLNYPWAPVADHAAEAIVALKPADAVERLIPMLKSSDPRLPSRNANGKLVIRELVRVNHLSNCVLCHAPSMSSLDTVRGLVPSPGQSPPPSYYKSRSGRFVRADITYLRQDFSVMQIVENPLKWAGHQRFDFFLRTRVATSKESSKGSKPRTDITDAPLPRRKADSSTSKDQYPEHAAVLFALRQLTEKDEGTTYQQWSKHLKETARTNGDDVAGDFRSQVKKLTDSLQAAEGGKRGVLIESLRDSKGAEYTEALALSVTAADEKERGVLRDALADRFTRMSIPTLKDYSRHDNAEVRRAAALACGSKGKDRVLEFGDVLIRLVADDAPLVVQAARASLKVVSDKDYGPEPDARTSERILALIHWREWWVDTSK